MLATQVFARFAHDFSRRALPTEVLHHAQRAVIDWYASLYPGLAMPAVRVLETTLAEDLDRGDARLALGRAATPRAAALINGTAAHAAEVDDSFRDAMYHPGAATIAAALAAAQATNSTGADSCGPWCWVMKSPRASTL
jgi:2-methylcitrate dehydratase PrpD